MFKIMLIVLLTLQFITSVATIFVAVFVNHGLFPIAIVAIMALYAMWKTTRDELGVL